MTEEVPEGWASAPLGDLIELRYGKGLPEKSRRPGRFAVFGSNGVVGQHTAAVTRGPAIIVGRKGSVGAVHYSADPCWPIDTTYFVDAFGPFEPKYLTCLLCAMDLSQDESSTAIPGLSREDAYRRMGLVPPLAEQRRIVERVEELLARINAARDHLAKIPPMLRRFRQSVLAAACSGRLTEDWRANIFGLRTANGKLPSNWVPSTVGELVKVATGATPLRKNRHYWGGSVPWVTSGSVNAAIITSPDDYITERALRETNAKVFPAGTLLVAMYGEGATRAKVAELGIESSTNQAVAALLFDASSSALRPWLKVVLEHQYARHRQLAAGGVQPNLSLGLVRSISIPLPPPEEQAEIIRRVERLLSIAKAIAHRATAVATRVDQVRQAILEKAFRGELVPTEAELAVAEGRAYETGEMLLERIQREKTRENGNSQLAQQSHARTRSVRAASESRE